MTTPVKAQTNRGREPRRKGFLVIVAALVLGLFALPATAMADDVKPDKVVVCDAKKDGYKIKLVKEDKVADRMEKHEEDGLPGGAVPGMPGYEFSAECVPTCIPASVIVTARKRRGANSFDLRTSDGTDIVIASIPYNEFRTYGSPSQASLNMSVPAELLPGAFALGAARGTTFMGTHGTFALDCGQVYHAGSIN